MYLIDEFGPYRITFHSNGLFTRAQFQGQNTFVENPNPNPTLRLKWHRTATGVETVTHFGMESPFEFEGDEEEETFIFVNPNKASMQVRLTKPWLDVLSSSPDSRVANQHKLELFGNGGYLTEDCTRVP